MIFDLILQWAKDRDLIRGSTPPKQMLKLTEEVGELAAAIARNNIAEAQDAIGDTVVVLTILAAQMDLDIEDCIHMAYASIKNRKGKMIAGVFVKDAEGIPYGG